MEDADPTDQPALVCSSADSDDDGDLPGLVSSSDDSDDDDAGAKNRRPISPRPVQRVCTGWSSSDEGAEPTVRDGFPSTRADALLAFAAVVTAHENADDDSDAETVKYGNSSDDQDVCPPADADEDGDDEEFTDDDDENACPYGNLDSLLDVALPIDQHDGGTPHTPHTPGPRVSCGLYDREIWDVGDHVSAGSVAILHIPTQAEYVIPVSRLNKAVIALDPVLAAKALVPNTRNCRCARNCTAKWTLFDVLHFRNSVLQQPSEDNATAYLAAGITPRKTGNPKKVRGPKPGVVLYRGKGSTVKNLHSTFAKTKHKDDSSGTDDDIYRPRTYAGKEWA